MKFAFFGSSDFSAIVLADLIKANLKPFAVIANPDRPAGRDGKLSAPAVKEMLLKEKDLNIELFQPKDPGELTNELREYNPDLFVVASYGAIIPSNLLSVPIFGTVGVHPSLLPKYRGASPIQQAILDGDKVTGVTLYLMDEKVDHGPLIAQREEPILTEDTYISLHQRLARISADMLIEKLEELSAGKFEAIEQDHNKATFTSKFNSKDGFVSPGELHSALTGRNTKKALSICRKIKALNPEPGVWTYVSKHDGKWQVLPNEDEYIPKNKKRLKLLSCEMHNDQLNLVTIQIEGGTPREAESSPLVY